MSKQLILITAPFNCGHCVKAIKELPSICEEQGFEFIEMKNEKGSKDNLPVDLYPTIMVDPYELWLEEDQVVLVDAVKEKSLSYHGNLEHAIKRISYLSVVTKEEDYTLTGFIESYKNIIKQLTSKFKI